MIATITLPAGQELIDSTLAAFKAGSSALVVIKVTTEPTTLPNAPAITTAMARSTTLPLLMNALKSERKPGLRVIEVVN